MIFMTLTIKHIVDLTVLIQEVIRHMNFSCEQSKFSFPARLVFDQLNNGLIVLRYDHLFAAASHLNQFGQIRLCIRNIDDHWGLPSNPNSKPSMANYIRVGHSDQPWTQLFNFIKMTTSNSGQRSKCSFSTTSSTPSHPVF